MTPRDIEKLKAIGYDVRPDGCSEGFATVKKPGSSRFFGAYPNEMAWDDHRQHAATDEMLKATMADKVRWLNDQGIPVHCQKDLDHGDYYAEYEEPFELESDSPEAAVDRLFWSVP